MNAQDDRQSALEGTASAHSGSRERSGASSVDPRRTRKPEEVAQILGVGRNGVYELIRARQLRCILVGRKILVPLTAIDEFLAGQTE
ncbi:helix-turn-helix domain-containing protein [Deinococcus aerophilus]|uniref:Helix-turn-helix domain-containing protein n=1 Tax=Deinococcus aerophilus TaxID=522488 RepID=A0ABQ2H1R7_9DEIO|nr:helix-turn-helix domain-containing protein [Deinococcus aerophilus]GGM22330.1 hypothetical protein GCM10010841_32770 [Deinococcus aerophilus]